ncbi:hypothetical protein EAF04_010309 [Stromatinia cepivora]|nr:hypothetical protein EAF04_010309 [Stromatinia cepivora]
MCAVVCAYGYCPIGACYCTALGLQKDYPTNTGGVGYALSDSNYVGLCQWTYLYGWTFPKWCSTTLQVTTIPNPSPFLPEACTGGERALALDGLDELCSFTCRLGYCPIHLCLCTSFGALVLPDGVDIPDVVSFVADPSDRDQIDLCSFACETGGYCACETSDGPPPCDFSLTFTDMDALYAASGNYPTYCNTIYILDVLHNNVTGELAEYNDANDGYDALFGYYQTYIKDEIPLLLDAFMGWSTTKNVWDATAPGNKYFECTYYDFSEGTGVNGTTQACPVARGVNDFYIYYTITNSTGFYADLQENYGIEADWVVLTEVDWNSSNCIPVDGLEELVVVPCVTHLEKWFGYPQMADSITITNPKDLFTKAGPAMDQLPLDIAATRLDMILGQWNGSGTDVIESYAMPVAMASQAIQSMDQVKVLGETEKEEEKKRLILLVLTAVLGVVPFVGEAGAALAGLTALARSIAIAGEAANAALSIYSVVEDPSSAPMTALGLLFGLGGLAAAPRDAEGLSEVAALRKEMKADDVAAMGATVDDQAFMVQKIIRACVL